VAPSRQGPSYSPRPRASRVRVFCIVTTLLLTACASGARRPVSASPSDTLAPTGFPATVRYVGVAHRSGEARSAEFWQRLPVAADGGAITILALSGGGGHGAFSAGALIGLSERADRPQFTVVTGVSAGALLAPFAFMGSAWDEQLTTLFRRWCCEQLMRSPGPAWLFRASVYEGKPLVQLVDRLFSDAMIEAVGEEASRGRLLLVATTNLDTQDIVIWDLGLIAAQHTDAGRRLFRQVLVASASYPGLLPPTLIRVEGLDGVYDEMHIDGAATAPFFIAPDLSEIPPGVRDALRGARIYVLLNRQLAVRGSTIPDRKLQITRTSFSANQRALARTTVEVHAAFAQRYGMTVSIASIPGDYPLQMPFDFRTDVLERLFDYGKQRALTGQLWTTPERALGQEERLDGPACETDMLTNVR
jgi:hypothetical protein